MKKQIIGCFFSGGCFFGAKNLMRASFVALMFVVLSSHGAVLSWSGGSGTSANWNDSGNWGFVGTPASGDTLIFSGSQPRLNNTNNIAGLTLNQIRFVGVGGGYVISGQAFTLTNSIEATNTSGTANLITNNITMGTPGDLPVDVGAGATLNLAGVLSGGVGLVKNGPGILVLAGALSNTYLGKTTVNVGSAQLAKSASPPATAIPGDLVIGDGVHAATVLSVFSIEIADVGNVTVNKGSVYDLNSNFDTIGGNLTLNGNATVSLGAGTLTLSSPSTITCASAGVNFASITGNGSIQLGAGPCTFNVDNGNVLYVAPSLAGSASITKVGAGDLYFLSANSYSGLTVHAAGLLWLSNSLSLGSPLSGTIVSNGATLGLLGNAAITNETLTLNGVGAPTFAALDSETSTTNIWAGPIILNADSTIGVVSSSARFRIIGPISGAGGLTHFYPGGGALKFEGTNFNSYAGLTTVAGGTLELAITNVSDGAAVPGSLVVASNSVVRLFNSWQLYQPNKSAAFSVTLNSGSILDLNGFSEWIGPLSMQGAQIQTGGGLLYMNGDITVVPDNVFISAIFGNLRFFNTSHTVTTTGHSFSPDLYIIANLSSGGPYGITKAGDGEVSLAGANTFGGFVKVDGGSLWLQTTNALGNATNVTVNAGGSLFVNGALNMVSKPLTLNGSGWGGLGALIENGGNSTWPGDVTLATDSVITAAGAGLSLTLSGGISGPGGLTLNGPGIVAFTGSTANTYAGSTKVSGGRLQLGKIPFDSAIPNDLVIGDGIGGANADVVQLLANNQINNLSTVTINSSGLFQENGFVEGIGGLNGSGNVQATGSVLDFYGGGSYQFDGVISGSAALDIYIPATHVWNGPNSYTGSTFLNAGVLRVNGSQPQSPITVSSGATLGGSGTVGNVTCSGTLAPGASPGILTTSNLIFTATGKMIVDVTGPAAGIGYDQVVVRGTNNLANATLQLNPALTTGLGLGQQLMLINNDLVDPVVGIFNGLPNNSAVNLGGIGCALSYAGGSGNDVVLTVTNIPGAAVGATTVGGNGGLSLDPNSCGTVNVVFTNLTATPITGIVGTLSTTNPSVIITQPNSPYPNVPGFGKGTNTVSFQVSVLPSFVCGSNITFTLNVSNATFAAFSVPVTVTTGAISPVANRYDVSIITNIPDVGTIESTNVVTGFTGPLLKATVALWLTHPIDSDLNLSLISPDGVIVPLSTGNGGGANFGSSCSPDASRTTFDDAAAGSITAGSSPFTGSFRPQSPLTAVIGGTASGNWRLRVKDNFAGSVGALRCWSLFLSPTVCNDGGGACALCPGTITNTLTTGSATQIGRLTRDGVASTCGASKGCPGLFDPTVRPYEAYPFYNGASNACVTITFTAPGGCDLFSSAYLGSFNPADLCANYLADAGNSTSGGSIGYSFKVPSNTVFTVVVAGVDSGVCGLPYTLSVTGQDCTPALSATPLGAQQLQLGWPTVAGGYKLEATPSLALTNWTTITNLPIATTNRFNVTNTILPTTNKLYRLHKP